MTQETIRILEEVRRLSNSEWEEMKLKLLELDTVIEPPKASSIEEKLYNLMIELGVPHHFRGYRYIVKAIMLCIEDPKIMEYGSVTRTLYPKIAKEFETTSSRVERAIRGAIETVCDRGNIERIQEIFGYSINPERGKPTNSEFIAGIARYISIHK